MATIRFIVIDVAAAVMFYRDHLGFAEIERYGPAMAIMARDDLTLWLAGPPSSAARPMPDGRVPEPGGWARMVLTVTDIAAEVARLTAAGVVFRNSIVTGPGGQQVLIQDPSGNPVELFQPG
jgi:catechol 2,3-dioxygenase-like lactoylglutathione lyase family enzyme